RQLPPLQGSVDRHQQPRYGARKRPSSLPGIPLLPIARVDDGAVDDLRARKVLVHLFDRRPKHRINWVRTVGKAFWSADDDVTPWRHDLKRDTCTPLTFGKVKKKARDNNGFYLLLRDTIEDLAIKQIADDTAPARFFHVQVENLPASLSDGSKDILIDPRLL